MLKHTIQIIITGLIQGVGFRPFVYRIALRHGLHGWVKNTNENVLIRVTGEKNAIHDFLSALKHEAPPASRIESISSEEIDFENFDAFTIQQSHNLSDGITEISPDIAVCEECLEDITHPGSRYQYPFVNCTNCGPRFTIVKDLPYDRFKTTMKDFPMCMSCRQEYETVTDRRFHAQPTACSVCGPQYELFLHGVKVNGPVETILAESARLLNHGGLMLMKGLGGMHLACDAFNTEAISRLRKIKKRDGKPFAVMFRDPESVKMYAEVDATEEQSLRSWRRPIVLLQKKLNADTELPAILNSGLNLIGVMLPYLPFHHLLFSQLDTPAIILTSGNFSSEPILTENEAAKLKFTGLVDAILLHNRDIENRTDDSVVRIMAGRERIFRRSRGYVPAPVTTSLNTDGILAFGAELTNCFCVGKGNKAFLSQHIGDLQGYETTQFYEQTIALFLRLFRVKPTLLAVDMHPDYISTKTARMFPDIPVTEVQHHHAHIAACMAEHNLDEKVIGIAMDGTGFGEDGHTWGSEFMVCDLTSYDRVSHFDYIPLPGGDRAAEEPWRVAVSWLYRVYGKELIDMELPMFETISKDKASIIIRMIDKKINTPLTSGAGRLFDAVASLLGLCQVATFQAEGPMRLESLVLNNCRDTYKYEAGPVIRFDDTIRGILYDLYSGTDQRIIATKFHNTILSAIFETLKTIRAQEKISKVVLSGGVFQNRYLLEGALKILVEDKFEVYTPCMIPANDGGIALGQLAIASKRRSNHVSGNTREGDQR